MKIEILQNKATTVYTISSLIYYVEVKIGCKTFLTFQQFIIFDTVPYEKGSVASQANVIVLV